MFHFIPPVLLALILVGLALLYLKYIHKYIVRFFIDIYALPQGVIREKIIFTTFFRVIYLNWYTLLMLIFISYLMLSQDVGKDMIEDYISKMVDYNFGIIFLSLGSLFITFFLLALAIWVIPFFTYSEDRKNEVMKIYDSFYLATKYKALLAILPFAIVGTAFLQKVVEENLPADDLKKNKVLAIVICSVLFILLFYAIQAIVKFIINSKIGRSRIFDLRLINNKYLNILVWVIIWHIILISGFALILYFLGKDYDRSLYVYPFYILISSAIVFHMLFFTDDSRLTEDELKKLVCEMISENNQNASRKLYLSVAAIIFLFFSYYFVVPSLTATNSLYVLLVVLALVIIYLDLARNYYRNSDKDWVKLLALAAILLVLVLPFRRVERQFSVPLVSNKSAADTGISMDVAIQKRMAYINADTSVNKSIYIICGMGGGSRAGYITASMLSLLEKNIPDLWNKTLFCSTISGSSPGIYHYLKYKEYAGPAKEEFLKIIYQRNYNSSGVFGFLFGDAFAAAFGSWPSFPLPFARDSVPGTGFRDRNFRIRMEYEFALKQAMANGEVPDYWQSTFSRRERASGYEPDYFKDFFEKRIGTVPIHVINTFAIHSGRRVVLSPFYVNDQRVFTNSILPLQERIYHDSVAFKDIMYRDATNLSELFPFLSGASTIGSNSKEQFVDGGYFENYGLATALDLYNLVRKLDSSNAKRIKFILIKNSLQNAKDSVENLAVQLTAPLSGAMSSPFTGHANHFLQLFENEFGKERFRVFTFDDERYKVPLTRALTRRHIKSMDDFIQECAADSTRNGKGF
ncbi:hypothetical protein [Pollutibacter soli]|uniref:hypothetical protein n=1 Tax=Pollutibacter soli TaxID=3034157 RepID=UPI0030138B43